MIAIIYLALAISFPWQYQLTKNDTAIVNPRSKLLGAFSHIAFLLLVILVIANIISVLLECGLSQCPDNPIKYII